MKKDSKWTLQNTADVLNRSIGSIHQAVTVGSWLKSHPNKIQTFRDLKSCLEWIKETERERKREAI